MKRNWRRWSAVAALAALGIVMALAFTFARKAARESVLRYAIDRLGRNLPAELRVESARWPEAGTFVLEGISLRGGEETLAAAGSLGLSVRLSALLHRDVYIRSFSVEGLFLDLPALRSTFAGGAETSEEDGGGGIPLLRRGAIPALPSLCLAEVSLSADSIRVADGREVADVRIALSAENRSGKTPEVALHDFRLRDGGGAWRIERGEAVGRRGDRSRAELEAVVAEENRLDLLIEEQDSGTYRIDLRNMDAPPASSPIAEGTVERESGEEPAPVRFDLRLRIPATDELRRYALLAPRLEKAPAMAALPCSVTGEWMPEDGSGEIAFRAGSNGWLRKGAARLGWGNDRLDVDSVGLALDGLRAEGAFRLRGGIAEGRCRIALDGADWLAPLLPPGAAPPPTVRGELRVESAGPLDSLETTARLELSEIGPAPAIRGVTIDARHSAAGGDVAATVEVRTDRNRVDLAALLDRSFARAAVGPIRIVDAEWPPSGPPNLGRKPGAVRFDRAKGSVELSAVELAGDYGRGRLGGTVSGEGGDLRLETWWDRPPGALFAFTEGAARETLQGRWRGEAPFRVDARLRFDNGEKDRSGEAEIAFDLPGLSLLSAALPAEASRRLAGNLAVEAAAPAGGLDLAGSVAIRPDGWIDTVAVRFFRTGELSGVDTAFVALRGLRLRGAGTAGDSLDARFDYELSTGALRALLTGEPPVDSLLLVGDLRLAGAPSSPRARLAFGGRALGPSFTAERLEGKARLGGGSVEGELRLGDGSFAGPVTLDRASVTWRGPASAPYLPGYLAVDAKGPDAALSLESEWDRDGEGLAMHGEKMALSLRDRTLETARPFDVMFDGKERRLAIHGLDLAGSLGTIRTDGSAGPDSADLTLHADLDIPRNDIHLPLPGGALPERIEVDATAKGRDRLDLTARAHGIDLGSRDDLTVELRVESSSSGLTARLAGANRQGPMIDVDADLPATVRIFPPGVSNREGPLRLEGTLADMPVPLATEEGKAAGWAELNGRFYASGTPSAPAFEGTATVGFPSMPTLADYRVSAEARTGGGEGIEGAVDVVRGGSPIAHASLSDPTRISLLPFEVDRDSTGTVRLDLWAKEIHLQDFTRWFPAGSSAEGDVSVEFNAEGPVGNPDLRGKMSSKKLKLKLADRSAVSARGEVRLDGTRRKPRIRGDATVDNGTLRLPENPKNLLPARGEAALWKLPAHADSTTAAEGGAAPDAGGGQPPGGVKPDVEVTLAIPSGLWIRGQGLDVELNGELSLSYRDGAPSVTGELAAAQGHFVFLGRTFRMESGTITFYGEEEINPALDIRLSINLEGTIIRVAVGGTLLDPQLGFTSEPPMEEGDIMSFLIFGRPLEDLNNNQMELVQRRAADIVTTFGSAQLEAKLAGQLGVDMVRIRETRGEAKGSSLVLGKYVSRKVLIEYEQALESNLFFVSLDYFLTRHLRLRTLYGQGEQSGMEMNWFNEY